jgi:hypothetical protein
MSDTAKALASITPKKREQIHQSFMNMLGVCQLRTMFRYKLGIRRPPAAFMHVGTAVDASVTKDLQNKIDTGELLKRQDAIDIAASTFEEREKKEPFELDPEEKKEGISKDVAKGEAKDKSVALAGLHYDKAAPVIQPKHVARKFSIKMDDWLRMRAKQLHGDADRETNPDAAKILHAEGAAMNSAARIGMDFAGEIDVVEEIHSVSLENQITSHSSLLVVRDTKTTTKSPSADAAEDSNQLVTYGLACLVLDKKIPNKTVLDYLVRTPKRFDLKHVPRESTCTMDDINVLLFRFARAVHSWHTACKTGSFLPANSDDWHCSERFCGYWDLCPAAKRPKLIQITKEVPSEQ